MRSGVPADATIRADHGPHIWCRDADLAHMLWCPANASFDLAAGTNANGCKDSDKGSDDRERRAFKLDLSTNWANGRGLVPHTGFEPVISALRGRCPGPLDECGTDVGRWDRQRTDRDDTNDRPPTPSESRSPQSQSRFVSRKARIASATCW